MKSYWFAFAFTILVAIMVCIASALFSENGSRAAETVTDASGLHGFDFLLGDWRVHHRRMLPDRSEWVEFEGTCSHRNLMDGSANMDEYVLNAPSGTYNAIGLRSYDRKTGQWSIWWLDSRYPSGPLDPSVQGRFDNGIGTFYSDYTSNGKPMRLRFIWSKITNKSAQWEQATSADGGKTWETNWIMKFQRVS